MGERAGSWRESSRRLCTAGVLGGWSGVCVRGVTVTGPRPGQCTTGLIGKPVIRQSLTGLGLPCSSDWGGTIHHRCLREAGWYTGVGSWARCGLAIFPVYRIITVHRTNVCFGPQQRLGATARASVYALSPPRGLYGFRQRLVHRAHRKQQFCWSAQLGHVATDGRTCDNAL